MESNMNTASKVAWHAACACVGSNAASVAQAWAATCDAARSNTAAAWCRAAVLWGEAESDESVPPDLAYQCALAARAARAAQRAAEGAT